MRTGGVKSAGTSLCPLCSHCTLFTPLGLMPVSGRAHWDAAQGRGLGPGIYRGVHFQPPYTNSWLQAGWLVPPTSVGPLLFLGRCSSSIQHLWGECLVQFSSPFLPPMT